MNTGLGLDLWAVSKTVIRLNGGSRVQIPPSPLNKPKPAPEAGFVVLGTAPNVMPGNPIETAGNRARDVRLATPGARTRGFGAVPGLHRAACFGRPPGLRAERGRLLEKGVGLGERGGGLELLEDVAGLVEGEESPCQVAERDEATALAEEGERLLRDDTQNDSQRPAASAYPAPAVWWSPWASARAAFTEVSAPCASGWRRQARSTRVLRVPGWPS